MNVWALSGWGSSFEGLTGAGFLRCTLDSSSCAAALRGSAPPGAAAALAARRACDAAHRSAESRVHLSAGGC
jgi:hypothetical protein